MAIHILAVVAAITAQSAPPGQQATAPQPPASERGAGPAQPPIAPPDAPQVQPQGPGTNGASDGQPRRRRQQLERKLMAPERFEMKSSTLKEFYEEAPAAPQPDDSAVPSVPAEPEGPAGAEAPLGPAAPLPPVRTVPSAIPATSGSPSTGGAPAAPPSQGAPPWAPWMAAVGAIAMLIGPFAGMLWLLRRDGTPGHTD